MAAPRTAIIIGGGIAGLSAGCYAQQAGLKATILEHHFTSGGVAACWNRKGFMIDGGIHFVPLPNPKSSLYKLYTTLGIESPDLYAPMKEYSKLVDEPSGKTLVLEHDLTKLSQYVKMNSPEDSKFVDHMIDCAKGMYDTDTSNGGMEYPPELNTFPRKLAMMWKLRKSIKYFAPQYSVPVATYTQPIKAPWLKCFIDNMFTPEVPMWFIFMILSNMEKGQFGYIKRGCKSFTGAMEKKYTSMGGEIRFKSTVTKVLVKDGKAYGVRLADGKEQLADYIVAAGDGYNTLYNLLEGKYISPKLENRHKNWKLCKPFIFLSYGLNRDLSQEVPFNTVFMKEPLKYGNGMEVRNLFIRVPNYSDAFAPPGKSQLQVEFDSDWKFWDTLRRTDRTQYMQAKQNLSDTILKRLESYYPGIRGQVEMTDIATPATTQRLTLNRQGSWGGWEMMAEYMKEDMERTLPGLKNFYMAGQWAMSGGVVPCLCTGKHAIDLIKSGRQQ